MARLHEYQGKEILAANEFKIPRGRAGIGGVAFAKEPEDVRAHPARTRSTSSRPFLTIHIK